jgi:hypothetical protein
MVGNTPVHDIRLLLSACQAYAEILFKSRCYRNKLRSAHRPSRELVRQYARPRCGSGGTTQPGRLNSPPYVLEHKNDTGKLKNIWLFRI